MTRYGPSSHWRRKIRHGTPALAIGFRDEKPQTPREKAETSQKLVFWDGFGSAIAHQLDESLQTSHHVIGSQELLLLFDSDR
jgi:hypothetical protein